jgi:hypothetical protein
MLTFASFISNSLRSLETSVSKAIIRWFESAETGATTAVKDDEEDDADGKDSVLEFLSTSAGKKVDTDEMREEIELTAAGGGGDVNASCDDAPELGWNIFDGIDVVGMMLPCDTFGEDLLTETISSSANFCFFSTGGSESVVEDEKEAVVVGTFFVVTEDEDAAVGVNVVVLCVIVGNSSRSPYRSKDSSSICCIVLLGSVKN